MPRWVPPVVIVMSLGYILIGIWFLSHVESVQYVVIGGFDIFIGTLLFFVYLRFLNA